MPAFYHTTPSNAIVTLSSFLFKNVCADLHEKKLSTRCIICLVFWGTFHELSAFSAAVAKRPDFAFCYIYITVKKLRVFILKTHSNAWSSRVTKLRLTGERKDLAAKIPKLIRFDTSKVRRLTLNLPVRTTIKLVTLKTSRLILPKDWVRAERRGLARE